MGQVDWKKELTNHFENVRVIELCQAETFAQFDQFCEFIAEPAFEAMDQRVEILGSKGSIATLNNYPNQAIVSDGQSVRRDLPLNFFMDRYTESFATEVSEFVDAVLEGKPVPVGGKDGRVSVVIALAAMKSYREGRPVRLTEIE